MKNLKPLYEAVLHGNARQSECITRAALDQGVDPLALVNDQMVPAMDEVGRRFECSEAFVPELILAAKAMKAALDLIRPQLLASGAAPAGKVVIGTVKGDLHDIGKNLVASMLEGSGFEVIDLGVNVPPKQFVAIVRERNARIVALSALLTTTMPQMRTTIEALRQADLPQPVKVLVGGAPIDQRFADAIGADGYSPTAAGAVTLARKAFAALASPQ